MKCCAQCEGIERFFDDRLAQEDLRAYRKDGPDETTRWLLDDLRARGITGLTLLDIGGGVGAIQHELLRAGATRAVNVDASSGYLKAAQQEAERLGHAERMTFQRGDFVALAPQIDPADIVTLDRVICCYPDMQALVQLSVERARKFYGVVFPRDGILAKIGRPVLNSYFRLRRNPYRFFVHPTEAVETIIRARGFQRVFQRRTVFWQVLLYERTTSS
jgi:magnesium-protoporphyrin O-methyltransferase